MVTISRKHVLFVSILILIGVFICGIMLGKGLSDSKLSEINQLVKESELNIDSYLIEQSFIKTFDEGNCQLTKDRIGSLSKELGRIGRMLETEGIAQSIGEENFNLLKKKYHLTQIRTYILYYKFIENCEEHANIIVFFYGADNSSKEQGLILDEIVKDYDTKVFAIQYNWSNELRFFESYHNITETPSLIINFETKKVGLTNYSEIKEHIV